MKLSQVLHPEIVLGRRGDAFQKRFYEEVLAKVSHSDVGYSINIDPELDTPIQKMVLPGLDPNLTEHLLLCHKFKVERPKVYHLGADWAEVMAGIDKEIPTEHLPARFFGYISFADKALHDGDEYVQGAYVFIGPGKETAVPPSEWHQEKVFWVSYVCEKTKELPNVARLTCNLADAKKLSQITGTLPQKDYFVGSNKVITEKIQAQRDRVYRCLLNTVLYIHAQDADLQNIQSHSGLSQTQAKKLLNSGKIPTINLCTLPVTLISHAWKKPRNFGVDATWVMGFWRWQRCGVGLSSVKLTYVKGHERHFNKTDRPEEAE